MKDVTTDEDVIDLVLLAVFNECREYFTILIMPRKRPNVDVGRVGNFNHQ
jgi:hypothetical protein